MKRALSILAICALLLVGLSTFALADGGAASLAITAEKVGEQVVATVKLNNYTAGELSAMTVDVNYNSDALTYKSVEGKIPEVEVQVKDNGAGKLLLCWVASELPATDDGIIAILTFDVKEVAEEESIGLSAGFVADGMVKEGSTEAIPEEEQEETFNSAPAELPKEDDIVIYPEGQEPGEEPDPEEPEEPAVSSITITNFDDPEKRKLTANVKAKYDDTTTPVDQYKIDILWEEPIVYTYSEILAWDTEKHNWYATEESAKWGENEPKAITLVNHSSQAVTAKFDYTPNANSTAMDFKHEDALIGENGLSIEKCPVGTPKGSEPQKVVSAIFNPNDTVIKEETTLGTIKITIA